MPSTLVRALVRALSLALSLAALPACSPTYNWREVRHDGAPMQALLPCKPERAEREVPALGPGSAPLTLRMMGCDSGGITFAFAALALPTGTSAADAATASQRWREAAWAGMGQRVAAGAEWPEGWSLRPAVVGRADVAQGWEGPARAADGRALRARLLVATHGDWLLQVAAYGERLPAEAIEPLVTGARFD